MTGLLLIVPGFIVLAVAGFAATGHLPRNPIVGFRTPVTFSSRAIWTAAHRAAAPSLALVGVTTIGAGLGVFLLQARPAVAGVMLLLSTSAMVGSFIWGVSRAADAAREAEYVELRAERAPGPS